MSFSVKLHLKQANASVRWIGAFSVYFLTLQAMAKKLELLRKGGSNHVFAVYCKQL